jgi:flagellar motor protein MotB
MTIVFHEGLFARGVDLTASARRDLQAVAAALNARSDAFSIEVEGHTDASPIRRQSAHGGDNSELGLARAKAAASFLVTQGGLPEDMVTTSSAGETRPPHPNTTDESRKRNRTVVLKIRMR